MHVYPGGLKGIQSVFTVIPLFHVHGLLVQVTEAV